MNAMIVEGPGDSTTVVSDTSELDAQLDRLHSSALQDERPTLITLYPDEAPVVRSLSIGVGSEASMANWADELDAHEPYVSSRGDGARRDSGQNDGEQSEGVWFYFGNQWSEFPPTVLIPLKDAREAALRFFSTGERPDNIEWQAL